MRQPFNRWLSAAVALLLVSTAAAADELDRLLGKLEGGFTVGVTAEQTSGRGQPISLRAGRLALRPGEALSLAGDLQVGANFNARVDLLIDPDQLFLAAAQGAIAVWTDLRAGDVPAVTRKWLDVLESRKFATLVAAKLRKENTVKVAPGRLTFISKKGGARAVVELDRDGLPRSLERTAGDGAAQHVELDGWRLGSAPRALLALPREQYQPTPYADLGNLPKMAKDRVKQSLDTIKDSLRRALEGALR